MCGHYRYDNIGKHLGVVEQYKTDPMVGSTCVREKVIKSIKKNCTRRTNARNESWYIFFFLIILPIGKHLGVEEQ